MTISRLSMTGISPKSFVTSENETAKVCRDHDIWRRKNFYFGFDFVGLGPEACFAQLDERSALFAVDFALSHPMGKALAIPSPAFRASLNAEIARTSLDNLAIYSERGALLRDLKAQRGGCVDGLLYGLCSSTNGLLAEVDGLKIGAIAGELSDDEVDPLEVYRMSQENRNSFCWRGASNGGSYLGGGASTQKSRSSFRYTTSRTISINVLLRFRPRRCEAEKFYWSTTDRQTALRLSPHAGLSAISRFG